MIEQTLFPVKEVPAVAFPKVGKMGDSMNMIEPTGYKFIIREDTNEILSCMTNDYKLVDNKFLIDLLIELISNFKVRSPLCGCSVIFVSISVNHLRATLEL